MGFLSENPEFMHIVFLKIHFEFKQNQFVYFKFLGKNSKNGLPEATSNPVVIWNQKVPNTGLEKFQKHIERKYNRHFGE